MHMHHGRREISIAESRRDSMTDTYWQFIAAFCLLFAAIGILIRLNREPRRCGHCGRNAVVRCKCMYCHHWTFGGL